MGILEGCSAGFWGRPQHLGSWIPTGFSPDDLFNTVFGRIVFEPDRTLLDVVTIEPPPPVTLLEQLARQAVAALLNAAHPDIHYPLTQNQVITMFQEAFDSGNYAPTKDIFEEYNLLFCPLS